VAPDELLLACRLSGLSVDDLWIRYVEIGGNESKADLRARLGGVRWSDREDRYLEVVALEALREQGLPALIPDPGPVGPQPLGPLARWIATPGEQGTADPGRSGPLPGRSLEVRLAVLLERSAHARATARGTRAWARSVREGRNAAGTGNFSLTGGSAID